MIEITANMRQATVTNKELLTTGSAGIQVQFTLSDDFAGLSKLAVFRQGEDGKKIDVALDSGLNCVVPAEVLTEEGEVLFIGIYGANGQGTVIIPTVWATAGVVKPGTDPNTPAEAEPTPEIWAQILGIAADAEQAAGDALTMATRAANAAEEAVDSCAEDRAAAEFARDQAQAASNSASSASGSAWTQALKSEGYAVGRQDGQEVGSDSPYYRSNAAFFAGVAYTNMLSTDEWKDQTEGMAFGTLDGYPVSGSSPYYHNNAKYYSDEAGDSATAAGASETNANTDALKAEGYSVGKQNGEDVSSGSPYYQNNAKYYAGTAASDASSASDDASSANTDALKAEGYAVGEQGGTPVSSGTYYHNNAKYYSDIAADYAEAADTWLDENVAQETGYVLDRSLTLSNAAAPADEVGVVVDNWYKTSLWEQGHIVTSTGESSTGQSYGRLRTISFIPENIVEISPDSGYTILPYAYQQDGTYVGVYNGSTYVKSMPGSFLTGAINLKKLSTTYRWRILVEKSSTTLTVSDGEHIKFNSYTDDTISVAGKAPDAKAVGNNFKEVMPNIASNINPFFQKWDIGHTINASGVYEANSYVAYTPVFYDAENTYVYTGASKDANNIDLFCYVHEYDSSFHWLNRHAINLPNAPITLDITSSNCKYIRLVFGRAGSTGVTFQKSDLSYFSMTVTENKLKMIPIQPNPVVTIPDGTINAMYALTEDYFNYAYQPEGISGIVYSTEASENANSAWSQTVEPVQTVGGTDQYTIQCSGFVNLVLRGVSFKNSRYTSGTSGENIGQPWGYIFDDSTKSLNVSHKNVMYTWDLIKYAQQHGFFYTVNQDGTNVRAGDILWTVLGSSDHYMGVVHVMLVLETGEDGRVLVAEATDVAARTVGGVEYPVGLRTVIIDLKSKPNVCYGARFPLGAVTQEPDIVVKMKPNISETTSENKIVKSYILNNIPQGFYTLTVRGDFSVSPRAMVRLTNGSTWVSAGIMLKSGNIYRMPIYITEPIDRVGIAAQTDSDLIVSDYDLFVFAHGYYNPETDLTQYSKWVDYPNKGRFLETDEDLDDLVVGEYLCNTGTIAASLVHCPTTVNFHLSMFFRTYEYPTQVIYGSNGCIYMRSWTSQGWQNWFKFQGTELT